MKTIGFIIAFAAAALTWQVAIDSTFKGIVLLLLASIAVLLMRKQSASARHLVWLSAMIALLLLPILSLTLPKWRVLPASMSLTQQPTGEKAAVPPTPENKARMNPAVTGEPQTTAVGDLPAPPSGSESMELKEPIMTVTEPITPVAKPSTPMSELSLNIILILSWAAVALILAFRLVLSLLALFRLRHKSEHLTSGRIVEMSNASCRQLDLDRDVSVIMNDARTMPMSWGIRRGNVLLPAEAQEWSDSRLRAVLLHELGHLKRRDPLVQVFVQVACAMHWFNPLVWFAAWRLYVERERACDDLVLQSGVKPSDYAQHLLDVVAGYRIRSAGSASAVAMARPSRLEGRLVAIMSEHLNRKSLTRRLVAATLVLGTMVVLPFAMIQAEANANAEEEKEEAQPGKGETSLKNFRGLDLTGYPSTTEFGQLPDLYDRRPEGGFRPRDDLFSMSIEDSAWLHHSNSKRVYYLSIDDPNTPETTYITYGPIKGDPISTLNLTGKIRNQSSKNLHIVLRMLKSGDRTLQKHALDIVASIEKLPDHGFGERIDPWVNGLRDLEGASKEFLQSAKNAWAKVEAYRADYESRQVEHPADGHVRGKKSPAKRELEVYWGRPVDGLQAGAVIHGLKQEHSIGDSIDARIIVKNIGEKDQKFAAIMGKEQPGLMAIDKAGRKHHSQRISIGGLASFQHYHLKQDEEIEVKRVTVHFVKKGDREDRGFAQSLHVTPGEEYTAIFSLSLPDGRKFGRNGAIFVPAKGEWEGDLKTGALPLKFAEAPADNAVILRGVKLTKRVGATGPVGYHTVDAKTGKPIKPNPEEVFEMPVGEGAKLTYKFTEGVYFVSIHDSKLGRPGYYGPIKGDPIADLKLAEDLRIRASKDSGYDSLHRLRDMLLHGNSVLQKHALDVIASFDKLPNYQFVVVLEKHIKNLLDAKLSGEIKESAERAWEKIQAGHADFEARRIAHAGKYLRGSKSPGQRENEPLWGPVVDGLQAGALVNPLKDTYSEDDEVDVRVIVRNTGKETRKFASMVSAKGPPLMEIVDEFGNLTHPHANSIAGAAEYNHFHLEPGEEREIKKTTVLFPRWPVLGKPDLGKIIVEVPPGKEHTGGFTLKFPEGQKAANPDGPVTVPAKGEWQGELKTGKLKFTVVPGLPEVRIKAETKPAIEDPVEPKPEAKPKQDPIPGRYPPGNYIRGKADQKRLLDEINALNEKQKRGLDPETKTRIEMYEEAFRKQAELGALFENAKKMKPGFLPKAIATVSDKEPSPEIRFVGTKVHAMVAGKTVWTVELKSEPAGPPVTAGEDTVIVTETSGRVLGLDIKTGKIKWIGKTTGRSAPPPDKEPENNASKADTSSKELIATWAELVKLRELAARDLERSYSEGNERYSAADVGAAHQAVIEAKIGYAKAAGQPSTELLALHQEQVKILEQQAESMTALYKKGDVGISATNIQRARSRVIEARIKLLEEQRRSEQDALRKSNDEASIHRDQIQRQLDTAMALLDDMIASGDYGDRHPKVLAQKAIIDQFKLALDPAIGERLRSELRAALIKAKAEMAGMKASNLYGNRHPAMIAAASRIEELEDMLQDEKEQATEDSNGQIQNDKSDRKRISALYAKNQEELAVASAALESLLRKREELATVFKPDSPQILKTDDQIKKVKARLAELLTK